MGSILASVYMAVRWQLTQTETRLVVRGRTLQLGQFRLLINPRLEEAEVRTLESLFSQYVLEKLAVYSLIALGILFVFSLVVGWVLAGRALAPVNRITQVAREIEVSDLSRRIALQGPDDELTRLRRDLRLDAGSARSCFQSQKRFLADTSHDFRTPLTVIRSNVEVALEDPQASVEDWRATGEIVARNAEKMGSMIDGLLAAARFESGQATMVAVDLAGLVRATIDDQRAAASDVEVALAESIEQVEVQGDPLCVEQSSGKSASTMPSVLRRLAAKSRSRRVDGKGGHIWRSPMMGRASHGGDGTGLGLGIVEQVTKLHRGQFQIYSEQGTTIVIWLPDGSESRVSDL